MCLLMLLHNDSFFMAHKITYSIVKSRNMMANKKLITHVDPESKIRPKINKKRYKSEKKKKLFPLFCKFEQLHHL